MAYNHEKKMVKHIKKPNLKKKAISHAIKGIDAIIEVHAPLRTGLPISDRVASTRWLLSPLVWAE